MSVPSFDVLTGMAEYFLSQSAVKQAIGNRLYDTESPERIVAQENTQSEKSPRIGTCVEYQDNGWEPAQNLDAESSYNVMTVEFRFLAFTPKDSRALFKVFWECFSGNRYRTAADGSGKWNGMTIKMANWIGGGMIFDETFRKSVFNATLQIRFASS